MTRHPTRSQTWLAGFGATLLALAPAAPAHALGFLGAKQALQGLSQSTQPIDAHPFGNNNSSPAFGLFSRGAISFHDAVTQVLRAGKVNPLIELRATSIKGFGLATDRESLDYGFFINGIPLCDVQVRAHELKDRNMLILGTVPEIAPYETAPKTAWPDLNVTLSRVTETVVAQTSASNVELAHKSQCLYVVDGHLLPVWNLTVLADGLPYTVLADAYDTVKMSRAFFDVDGDAQVYPKNRLDPALVPVKLTDLTGDGSLSSTYLKTIVPPSYTAVKEPTMVFNFPTTDKRFDEVQVYAHAQTHFDWFKSMGFEWYGPTPLEIKIHIAPAGRPNNALFIPGSTDDGTLPSISIHDGDGVDLQNLISDGDVVSHEFGHHVIYKTLRVTDGESLVLHEGLADFFAFSRTGDPCLGESICPKGSPACIQEGQCLRTAANGLVYNDQLWNDWAGTKYRLGHLHGQLVSGLLWDLRTEFAVPGDDLSRMVMKAVSYFKRDSGLRDFMLALFTADSEVFGAKYSQQIRDAANKRGLAEFFVDVTPGQPIPPLSGNSSISGASTPATKEKKKDKKGDDNPFSCGTIAYDMDKTSAVVLSFLLALPLFFACAPVPARARARARAKGRRTRS